MRCVIEILDEVVAVERQIYTVRGRSWKSLKAGRTQRHVLPSNSPMHAGQNKSLGSRVMMMSGTIVLLEGLHG